MSVQVIANEFRPSRNFRKMRRVSADLVRRGCVGGADLERYSVFRAYLDQRHHDGGGMADMTVLITP